MRFLLLCALLLSSVTASAETLRVAVARGQRFRVEGTTLTVRSGDSDEREPLESPAVFEHVGPFISTGDELDTRWIVEDADGSLTVNETIFGGAVEFVLEKGSIVAIDCVDLETYVASVVGAELPPSWPPAALEAQAIATRTYALQRRDVLKGRAPYDLESTVAAQVYKGRDSHSVETVLAAHQTRGKVLMYKDELAEAYFFSKCSGKTESSKSAFGKSVPYLVPVSCEVGDDVSGVSWKKTFSLKTLKQLLASYVKGELNEVEVESSTPTGRVSQVAIRSAEATRRLSGAEFRRLIGYQALPSLSFALSLSDTSITIVGTGSGHGVGLCQWGAYSMAKRGQSADEILKHFYPGTTIEELATDVVAVTKQ